MTFITDEISVESSSPRIGVKIQHGTTTYRITTSKKDEVFDGEVYLPFTVDVGEAGAAAVDRERDQTFAIPTKHPLCVRYMSGGIPPKSITVEFKRLQSNSYQCERFWLGKILSMSVSKGMATFLVASSAGEAFRRKLPTVSVSRTCQHMLFAPTTCKVDPSDYFFLANVTLRAGQKITVDNNDGRPDGWANYGTLMHISSGEAMPVFSHVGHELTLQFPIQELQDSDAVKVYAGCNHFGDCSGKFQNMVNFSGMPQLPTKNPWIQTTAGISIYSSEG